jgi:gliding motility-associated-like protein
VYDYPEVLIYVSDTVLYTGGESTIEVTGADSYTWIYGGVFPCDNCSVAVYHAPDEQLTDETFEFILISESNNCQVTDTVRITVLGDIPLKIPEGFSPNGDGNADTWVIQGTERLTNSEVHITNRWGNKVYTSTPYNNDWGGENMSGGKLPAGTYYYIFRPDKDGEESYAGYVYVNY